MRFYADTDEAATLAAMLATMGHVLHTTDRFSKLTRAVLAVGGKTHIRVPTQWTPGLLMAAEFGGSTARHAGVALAVLGDAGDDPVDCVIGDGFAAGLGVPVFAVDDMAGVMGFAGQC